MKCIPLVIIPKTHGNENFMVGSKKKALDIIKNKIDFEKCF